MKVSSKRRRQSRDSRRISRCIYPIRLSQRNFANRIYQRNLNKMIIPPDSCTSSHITSSYLCSRSSRRCQKLQKSNKCIKANGQLLMQCISTHRWLRAHRRHLSLWSWWNLKNIIFKLFQFRYISLREKMTYFCYFINSVHLKKYASTIYAQRLAENVSIAHTGDLFPQKYIAFDSII